MQKYEIVLLINQDIPHQGVSVISNKIESLLDNSGKIVASEYWGLRELAYPIVNQKKARYFILYVEMSGDIVKVISDYIKINESIIRSAIYKIENFDYPSEMLSYKKNLAEASYSADFINIFPNSIAAKETNSSND